MRSFVPRSAIPTWYPHVAESPVVFVTAVLEAVLNFTLSLVAVLGAEESALALKSQTPTSLFVAVFLLMFTPTVNGVPVPSQGPPTTRIPAELVNPAPVYWLSLTVLPVTVAFAP